MIKLIAYWQMIGGLWWLSAPMFGAASLIAHDKGFDVAPALAVASIMSFISLFVSYITHSEARDEFEDEKRFYKRAIEEKIEKVKRAHEHMIRQQQDIINADEKKKKKNKNKNLIAEAAKGEMIYDPDTGEELGRLDIAALERDFFAEPGSHFYGPWRLDK
jgi:hypothetical protein